MKIIIMKIVNTFNSNIKIKFNGVYDSTIGNKRLGSNMLIEIFITIKNNNIVEGKLLINILN